MHLKEILTRVDQTEHSAFFYTPSIYKNGNSFFFKKPENVLNANNLQTIKQIFSDAEKFVNNGGFAYVILPYETAYLFEPKLEKLPPQPIPEVKIVLTEKQNFQVLKPEELIIDEHLFCRSFEIKNYRLNTGREEFVSSIKKIKKFIKRGDTYQVNFTLKGKFDFNGDKQALFFSLIFNQSAKYSAYINNAGGTVISISPELFFKKNKSLITTKPMKGTIKRGINPIDDERKFEQLKNSEKDKAENLMIVDLLRNDLGRICKFGTVRTKDIFEIEKYESVYQMVSTVSGSLKKNISLYDIIKNIFPCGSVTGAPKMRTMELIHSLEKQPRGIYTGAIGILTKDNYTFNVPIRTIELENGKGSIGLGSGIVWDSKPVLEFNEVLLKSNFLTKPKPHFKLIESLLLENGKYPFLSSHLKRLKNASNYFSFVFDENKIKQKLFEIKNELKKDERYKIRLLTDKWGNIQISSSPVSSVPAKVEIIISNKKINSQNQFQYFKTTNRGFYNNQRQKYVKGKIWEVIFPNEKNQLAEGTITNIFVMKNGKWFTPPLSCGVLNGIYRDIFIKKYNALEKILFEKDLYSSEKIVLTNAVAGEVIVDEIHR